MLELLAVGVLAFAGLCVLGLFWSIASLVCWVLFLPFKLLGFLFRGFAFLLALPFMLLFGVLALIVFGAGLLMFLFPALPVLLLAAVVWWLVRRRDRRSARVAA